METSCPRKCQAISQSKCGELLCLHVVTDHAMPKHPSHPLSQRVRLDRILANFPKKTEIVKLGEFIVFQVQATTSYQLKELKKRVIQLHDEPEIIDQVIEWADAVGPSKNRLEQLKALIDSLGTEKLSGSFDNTVKVWNLAPGQQTQLLKGQSGAIWSVAISRKDKFVVSGSKDNTVKVWNLESRTQTLVLQGHTDRVNLVKFSRKDEFKKI